MEVQESKTKKKTITKNKNEGGLNMMILFDKALKITWVKRLYVLR